MAPCDRGRGDGFAPQDGVYGLTATYLLTAFGVIAGLRRPLWGLYVYVGFAVLRPEALFGWAGDLTHVSLFVGIAMLIGWALHGFGSWELGRARSICVALGIFTVWCVGSAALARFPSVSFAFFPIFAKTLLPFVMGVTLVRTKKEARQLLWIIVLAQAYVGFELNVSYYLKHYNQLTAMGFSGMDDRSFGVALVTVLGAAVGLTLFAANLRERLVGGVACGLILHAALLSFSRGAFVGAVAIALVAFVVTPKRPRPLAALLVLSLIAVRLTGPQLVDRFSTTFAADDERDTSAESRIELWTDCLRVMAANPFFGIGVDNWPYVAAEFGWTQKKEAHSVWFQTAAETGAPGVIALLAFYGLAIAKLWPVARGKVAGADRHDRSVAAAVIIGVVGFAVSAQFVSLKGLEHPYYLVMAGAALLRVLQPATARESAPVTNIREYLHPAIGR